MKFISFFFFEKKKVTVQLAMWKKQESRGENGRMVKSEIR